MIEQKNKKSAANEINFEDFKSEVLNDYRIACESREVSLIGRREVHSGKAKFGIFGDGKEVAQVAMAKFFLEGDWRSGYYRDQTFMMAAGLCSIEQYFAQLYADTEPGHDPFSAGRQMNAHFATPTTDENGDWLELKNLKNISADTSPTAGQMSRAVGLALASKIFREKKNNLNNTSFSDNGNEVVFCTIGDASTSEGVFWEALNAAGVQRIPMAIFVWDDGYGISVPKKYQTTKENISEIIKGFKTDKDGNGIDIYTVKAWDYPALVQTFQKGISKTRETHIPCLFHVQEVTQPQGHSTSGSHERYKSKERMAWEIEMDCNKKMREWILENNIAVNQELEEIEKLAKTNSAEGKKDAWTHYITPIKNEIVEVTELIDQLSTQSSIADQLQNEKKQLSSITEPMRRDIFRIAKNVLRLTAHEELPATEDLKQWLDRASAKTSDRYNSHLHSESKHAALNVTEVKPQFSENSKTLNGFEILNACFDLNLKKYPELFAFGEDLGKIGDVNQGFAGLQDKYGENRVFDTGIRENTIIGQGIGMAMRGLRPIAEIQYLDYLIFGIQPLTDDLATLQYRTKGIQKAPVIIRTRGHRLEGIWHTGSPMGMILGSMRGIHILVPRNMVQAAGFYNTMLQSDEPALVIECLNGYRLKEKLPDNLGEFTLPLGVPETIIEGTDVTIVSYGSTLRIAQDAIARLNESGISVELIDVQSLLPFDIHHHIETSVQKTNRVIFLDEDVPGGASAFMMQQVLEHQNIWQYLDAPPKTVSAKPHRTAYGSDADYFCKPNADEIFEAVYDLMHETDPQEFPKFY